ncbi:hypothetical protein, partial [uncultured Escherichia sp.]|uniref:hypothetical protein n=1 Tax=uncultured Escherichia sp. TaxID=237777 RepID=UPI00258E70DD
KQKKLIMLPSETMIWQPEFTDKTLSRKTGAVQNSVLHLLSPRYAKSFPETLTDRIKRMPDSTPVRHCYHK